MIHSSAAAFCCLAAMIPTMRVVAKRVPAAVRPRAAALAVSSSHRLLHSASSSSHGSSSSSSSSSFSSYYLGAAVAAVVVSAATGLSLASAESPAQAKAVSPAQAAKATLSVDYTAVRKEIADVLDAEDYDDGSYGPLFVRLAWHSSGSYSKLSGDGGSNGAAIRFPPERDWGGNKGLQLAVQLLEAVKRKHPGISYGDLYTLAGVVAVEEMGGPKIPWRPGRLDYFDGKKSPGQDNRLPDAAKGAQHLRDVFYRMGFDDREIVALSGAHALGRCHKDRSGFDGPWTRAPTTFSNEYFKVLLNEAWTERQWSGPRQFENSKSGRDLMMLPTDHALLDDAAFKRWVETYAKDEELFFKDFAAAFGKLLELGVKFDAQGDVQVTEAEPQSWWNRLFQTRGNKSGHN